MTLWLTKREAAEFVTAHYFSLAPRGLENWNIASRLVSGKRRYAKDDVIACAERLIAEGKDRKLKSSPPAKRRKSKKPE